MAWHRIQNNDERVLSSAHGYNNPRKQMCKVLPYEIMICAYAHTVRLFVYILYIINNDDKNNKHFGIFKESAEWPLFIEYSWMRAQILFVYNK